MFVELRLLADDRPSDSFVMGRMQALAATTHDSGIWLSALPPLVNVLRYGDERGTDTDSVAQVMDGLVLRTCIALPQAASGINSEAAQVLLEQMIRADHAIHQLQQASHLQAWLEALERCVGLSGVHAMIAGHTARILHDQDNWTLKRTGVALPPDCTHPCNALAQQ